jgi:hypothetical protein
MKVRVVGTYSVFPEGDSKGYTAGDVVDVPAAEAEQWLRAGYVEKVSEKKTDKK